MDGRKEITSDREDWDKDGFDSYDDYEAYYVKLVNDLHSESKEAWKDIKRRWAWADKKLELKDSDVNGLQGNPTRSRLPLVHHAMEEAVSALIENLPRPTTAARQPDESDFASGISYFIDEILDENGFDVLMGKTIWNQKRMFLGAQKITVDLSETGPLGKDGKIKIRNIDARHVWPDPFARSLRWEDMRYLLVAEPYDLTEIREMFPARGEFVAPEKAYSLSREPDAPDEETTGSSQWWSPMGNSDGGFVIGSRHRAMVKELWLKDERREFVPATDDKGNVIYDLEGEAVGYWRKRYPHGRCIITAGNKVLADFPNTYWHRRPPYVFYPSRLSSKVLSHSDLEMLCRIEDKINIMHQDLMKNARVNMNAPWVTDTKTFPSRDMYKRLTSTPGEVLITNPNTRLERMPPGEIPSFIFPLMDWLQEIFDDVLGIQAIMRGQLQKGSQISAATVDALQGTATSRMRLKARLLEAGLKELGYQLHWLIRQYYGPEPGTEPKPIQIKDPATGEVKEILWGGSDADRDAQEDFPIEIQAGSSMPGAKQGAAQQAILLFQNNLIDRQAALAAIDFPHAAEVTERMNNKEKAEMLMSMAQKGKMPSSLNSLMDGRANNAPNVTGEPGRKPGTIPGNTAGSAS